MELNMQTRILRRHQVERKIGLSRSSIYQMMSDGTFPLPIKLGKRAVGWAQSDIDEWLSNRRQVKHDNG